MDEKQTPPVNQTNDNLSEVGNDANFLDLSDTKLSTYKESVLEYIGGFIVRKLSKRLSCELCCVALHVKGRHSFIAKSLTSSKDRGGLVYPSSDALKIINIRTDLQMPCQRG